MPSLGNDLAAIRKKLDLTIEDIHKATKIPTHILRSIEDNSIFDDLNKNATYVRSYVRSFAKKLNIDEERIVWALDQVERGTYSGLLREDPDVGPSLKFQSKPEEPSQPKQEEKEETAEEPDISDEPFPEPKQDPPETSDKAADVPTVQSVDWVDMGRRFRPLESKSHVWTGIVILVVAVISVAGIIYFFNRNANTSELSSRENAPLTTADTMKPDSLQLNLSSPDRPENPVQSRPAGPAGTLSDTLNLVIYAAYEKLEPVRVYTDVLDSLNPYWIELGEAVRFKFVNTIRIRGQYRRMVLLLNGHVIENFTQQFLNQESGMVEINREAFEGESKWLRPPPASLGLDVPDPTVIKDQPIFN